MSNIIPSPPLLNKCIFPYCPFYFNDFFKSPKVLVMSDAEIVDYVRLLAYEWYEGFIINDLSAIARICLRDLSTMKRHWKTVSKCFCQDPSDSNKLLNKRMEGERQKCLIAKEKRIERARKGGFGKSQKISQSASNMLEADSKQSFSREKAARKQCLPLLRASDSLSERESDCVLKGKVSRGKPKRDPLQHKNVCLVADAWATAFPRDASIQSARAWIARRLRVIGCDPGTVVPYATPLQLLKAVKAYADEQASYRRVHDVPNHAQYKARNFFDAEHNYVLDYLPPTKKG